MVLGEIMQCWCDATHSTANPKLKRQQIEPEGRQTLTQSWKWLRDKKWPRELICSKKKSYLLSGSLSFIFVWCAINRWGKYFSRRVQYPLQHPDSDRTLSDGERCHPPPSSSSSFESTQGISPPPRCPLLSSPVFLFLFAPPPSSLIIAHFLKIVLRSSVSEGNLALLSLSYISTVCCRIMWGWDER